MTNRDQHDECLSAFLDGELRASDVDRLLDVLDDELTRERLQVWSSVRCAMTHPEPLMKPVDISREVSQAIAAERSARVVPIGRRRWARSAAGFAIAASVVAAVVVNVVDTRPGVPERAAVAAAPAAAVPAAVQTVAAAQPTASKELVIALPEAGNDHRGAAGQLNPYLINHVRYGGGYALGGSLGYARVAASTDDDADQR